MFGACLILLICAVPFQYCQAQSWNKSDINALEQIQHLPYFLHTEMQNFELNLDDYFTGNNVSYHIPAEIPNNIYLKASIGSRFPILWTASIEAATTVNKVYIPNLSIYGWKSSAQWIALVNSSILMFGTGFGKAGAFDITKSVQVCNASQYECHDFILINGEQQVLLDCSDIQSFKHGNAHQNKFITVHRANYSIISQYSIQVTDLVKYPFTRKLVLQGDLFYRYVVGNDYFESYSIIGEDPPQLRFKRKYDAAYFQISSPLSVLGIQLLEDDLLLLDQKGSVMRVFNGSGLPDQSNISSSQISTFSVSTPIQTFDVSYQYANDYKSSRTIVTVGGGNKLHQIDWTKPDSPVYLSSFYIGLPFAANEVAQIQKAVDCKKYLLIVAGSSTNPGTRNLLIYKKIKGERREFFYSMNLTKGLDANAYVEVDHHSLHFALFSSKQVSVYSIKDSILSVSKGDDAKEYSFNLTVMSVWGGRTVELDIVCFGAKTSENAVAIWRRGELPQLMLTQLEHYTMGLGGYLDGPLFDFEPIKTAGIGWKVYTISQVRTEGYPLATSDTIFASFDQNLTADGQFNLYFQQKNREYDQYSCVFQKKNSNSQLLNPVCKYEYKRALDTDVKSIFTGSEFNFVQGKTNNYLVWKDGKYEVGERYSKYNMLLYVENKFMRAMIALDNSSCLLHVIELNFNAASKKFELMDNTLNLAATITSANITGKITNVVYQDSLPYIIFVKTTDTIYLIDISNYQTYSSVLLNNVTLTDRLTPEKSFSFVIDANNGLLVVALEQNETLQGFEQDDNMIYTYSIKELLDGRESVAYKSVPLGYKVLDSSLDKNIFHSDVTGNTYLVVKDIKSNIHSILQLNLEKALSSALQSQQELPSGLQILHLDIVPHDPDNDLIHIWSNSGFLIYQATREPLLEIIAQSYSGFHEIEIYVTENFDQINPLSLSVFHSINILDSPAGIFPTSSVNDTFMTKLFASDLEKFAFTTTNFFFGPVTSFVIVNRNSVDAAYKVYENIYMTNKIASFEPTNSSIKSLAAFSSSLSVAMNSKGQLMIIDHARLTSSLFWLNSTHQQSFAFTDCRFLFLSKGNAITLCQSTSQALLRIVIANLTDTGVSSSRVVSEISCTWPIEAKLIQNNYLFILDAPLDSDPVFRILTIQPNCATFNCTHELLTITPADLGLSGLRLTGFDIVSGLNDFVKIFFTDLNIGIIKLFVEVANPANITYTYQIFPLQKSIRLSTDPQFINIRLVSTDIINQHVFFVVCRKYHTLLLKLSEQTTTGVGSLVGIYQIFYKYPYNINIGSISFDNANAFMLLGVFNTLTNRTELIAYSIMASLSSLQLNYSESLGRYQLIGSVPIASGEADRAGTVAIMSSNAYGLTGTFIAADNCLGTVARYFLSTNVTFESANLVFDPREIRAIAINDFGTSQVVMTLNEQDIGQGDVIFVVICILLFFVVTLVILMGIVFEKSIVITTFLENIFDKVK